MRYAAEAAAWLIAGAGVAELAVLVGRRLRRDG